MTKFKVRADFDNFVRGNFSPHAVAMIASWLQAADCDAANDHAIAALRELEWFRDALVAVLGDGEYDRLVKELGL
jgi:hypothetical protein